MWGCFLMSGALFERLMEIHSNSPKLYYGFNMRNVVCSLVDKNIFVEYEIRLQLWL